MNRFPNYNKIFVVTPFASEFNDFYFNHIKSPLENEGYEVEKADTKFDASHDDLLRAILESIQTSGIIIVNNTGANPNVLFEYGYAYALQKKVVCICKDPKELPADIRNINHIEFGDNITDFERKLISKVNLLRQSLENSGESQFSEFWNGFIGDLGKDEKVYMVVSAKGKGDEFIDRLMQTREEGHTEKVSFNEVDPLVELGKKLTPFWDRFELHHGNLIYPRSGRLIVVGSSHANSYCNDLFEFRKDLPMTFEKIERAGKKLKYIRSRYSKTTFPTKKELFQKQENETNSLRKDFGLICRLSYPKNESRVLLLAGNHGIGTESAVIGVSDYSTVKLLQHKVGNHDFQSLIETLSPTGRAVKPIIKQIAILDNDEWKLI